jgi:hypothetical protein
VNDYPNTKLKIDKSFKTLIPPLSPEEFEQLTANLINEGCRDPICVWKGIIIDGHNRYEICLAHSISFKTQNIELETRDEIVAWICANQLGRRNITEETRKYLIGKRYESEKRTVIANLTRKNLHFSSAEPNPELWDQALSQNDTNRTSDKLADEYHLSHSTIEKYGEYARAIDTLTEKKKEITPKILSGQTKMSHRNVVELSKLSIRKINSISEQMNSNNGKFIGYTAMRKELENSRRIPKPKSNELSDAGIKKMPVFDPDAEISSLTLTIPSWISTMKRTSSISDLALVSDRAKNELIIMLNSLIAAADTMLGQVKE